MISNKEIPVKFIANYKENNNKFNEFAIISKKDDSNLILSVAKEKYDLLFCRTYGIISGMVALLKTDIGEIIPEKYLSEKYNFDPVINYPLNQSVGIVDLPKVEYVDRIWDKIEHVDHIWNTNKEDKIQTEDLNLFNNNDGSSVLRQVSIINYDIDKNFFSIIKKDRYNKSIKKYIYQIKDDHFYLDDEKNGCIVNDIIPSSVKWLSINSDK